MINMLNVKWLDVYEMIMNQKREIQDELEEAKKQAVKSNISYEAYLEFKINSYIRLETLDNVLKGLDRIENEQAERVQELEETVEDYKTVNKELHLRGRKVRKQNKRYREWLEKIERNTCGEENLMARKALAEEGLADYED